MTSRPTTTIIPANPGFELLIWHGNSDWLERHPVVA
jgi:hypothetical protein